jgi:hypothetical protein
MSKFFNKKVFLFLIVIFGALPTFFALLKPGYYNMHDDMQMIRQLEMEKCIKDGQIPCRWTPDLGFGYGYPLFNFYPPMPYIVGQVFRTFGFSFLTSVKLASVTQIILSAIFMYILAASIFGPIGGVISSFFYTYAPYHALNVYVRGAMNEAWAAVFFPLIFYFSRNLIVDKKWKNVFGLSLSYAGLLLSHNPMVLTFTPIFFVWCLYWLISENKKNFFAKLKKQIPLIAKFIFSGVFALCLTAFFTIPVLKETKYTHIDTMFQGYYSYEVHFTTIKQLFFSNFWSDGPSVWGPEDGMSFMIGFLHWIIPTLIIFISGYIFLKKKKIDKKIIISILLALLGFGAAFMTHNKSTFIWEIFSPIQKIQFPWRFLNHVTFLLSLSVGVFPFLLKKLLPKKIQIPSLVIIIAILIGINVSHFFPIHSGPLTDQEKFTGKAWEYQVTSGIYDYLPITASIAPEGPAKPYVDNISPDDAFVKINGQKTGSDWMYFNLSLNKNARVTLSELAFPDFVITDNGKIIDYTIENKLGRMVIILPSGEHQIFVKFTNTPIRTVSNYISLIAWVIVLVFFTKPLWSKLTLKK